MELVPHLPSDRIRGEYWRKKQELDKIPDHQMTDSEKLSWLVAVIIFYPDFRTVAQSMGSFYLKYKKWLGGFDMLRIAVEVTENAPRLNHIGQNSRKRKWRGFERETEESPEHRTDSSKKLKL